ncbi:phage tail protein [Salmonella enterica]|nr:phage tail protein [Salmonella enterica]EDL1780047.1 hypothetical protein [Salmonella enterica subsp. enterica serovar Poona]EED3918504.1 phage tail protein [Salmonella enterica subsp. enterica]EBN4455231.1 hypothetical protein [Salmonella enterica]EEL6358274.1 phage tail protein [Salmonella enterica]
MIVGMYGSMPFVASSMVVNTFANFKRSSKRRLARHEVIGLKPVLEDIGPDLDEVSFTMRLDTTLGVVPLAALSLLRVMHSAQEVNPVVIGIQYFGNFVISDIDEGWTYFGPTGNPRVINVGIKLLESGQVSLAEALVDIAGDIESKTKSALGKLL